MYRSDLSASNPRPKVPKLAGSAKSSPDKPPGLLHPVFTLLRKSLPASHLLSHSYGNTGWRSRRLTELNVAWAV